VYGLLTTSWLFN